MDALGLSVDVQETVARLFGLQDFVSLTELRAAVPAHVLSGREIVRLRRALAGTLPLPLPVRFLLLHGACTSGNVSYRFRSSCGCLSPPPLSVVAAGTRVCLWCCLMLRLALMDSRLLTHPPRRMV